MSNEHIKAATFAATLGPEQLCFSHKTALNLTCHASSGLLKVTRLALSSAMPIALPMALAAERGLP
jgi:hypothetical protein